MSEEKLEYHIVEYRLDKGFIKNIKKFLKKFPDCFCYIANFEQDGFLDPFIVFKLAIPETNEELIEQDCYNPRLNIEYINDFLESYEYDLDMFPINKEWAINATELTLKYVDELKKINNQVYLLQQTFETDFNK